MEHIECLLKHNRPSIHPPTASHRENNELRQAQKVRGMRKSFNTCKGLSQVYRVSSDEKESGSGGGGGRSVYVNHKIRWWAE